MSITKEQAEELRDLYVKFGLLLSIHKSSFKTDGAYEKHLHLISNTQKDFYNLVGELSNEEIIHPVNFIGFKRVVNFTGYVPVLGPFEHKEITNAE